VSTLSKLQKAIVARLLLLAAFWLSGCSFLSSPIDVSGVWEGHIEWTTGFAGIQSPITLDLVHDGRELSGTVTLIGPGSTPFDLDITRGSARTHTMSLEASGVLPIDPPQNVTIELDGDFHNDQMSGTGTQSVNGSTYQLIWEAVLIAPAAPEE
jgi:hypothetical protein